MYLYQFSLLVFNCFLKQDIFNAVLKEHPYFVYHLPCQWNVQLSDNSKSDKCYNQLEEPKVNIKLLRRNENGMQNSDKLQTISVELILELKFQPIIRIIIFAMTMFTYTFT